VSLTPSARSLLEMRTNDESFFRFALRMSQAAQVLPARAVLAERVAPGRVRGRGRASLAEQARVEASDTISFDEYWVLFAA